MELMKIFIRDIRFAEVFKIENGTLFMDAKCLKKFLVSSDPRIKFLKIEIAKPGQSARIIPVKDVIEPRFKPASKANVFPGLISDSSEAVGLGKTLALKGMAITTVGPIVGFQEGLIDMSGPGAEYTIFSKLLHVVLDIKVRKMLSRYEHEEVLRLAGLRAAKFLAQIAERATPDEIEIFSVPDIFSETNYPRVAYLYMLQSQGLLHDTYYYGADVKKILPTLISSTEVFDGAIVSGNCVSACDKNTTYHHQNNPIITELLRRHGRELYFCGCVIGNENITFAEKQRSSALAVKLIASLKPDCVIISKEGFGNPDADMAMNCRALENLGVKTVCMTDEYAGQDGGSQSLADITASENAIVSVGNANEIITLPPMKKIIGSQGALTRLAGGSPKSVNSDGSINVELQVIIGATNQLGFEKLSAKGV